MQKIMTLPSCPYCHKKISYVGSMFMKTKGEHCCSSCKCISNVVLSRAAYALASAVCIIALLIVLIYSISGDHGSFLGIACVLAPFLIFYLSVPLLVRLVPCKDKSAVKKLIDKSTNGVPSDVAYQSAAASSPVKLDVEEDFSTRFMKAKKETKQAESIEDIPSSEFEEEDIQNTKIAFSINSDSEDG